MFKLIRLRGQRHLNRGEMECALKSAFVTNSVEFIINLPKQVLNELFVRDFKNSSKEFLHSAVKTFQSFRPDIKGHILLRRRSELKF